MTDIEDLLAPPYSRLPLVHDETDRLPDATMQAIREDVVAGTELPTFMAAEAADESSPFRAELNATFVTGVSVQELTRTAIIDAADSAATFGTGIILRRGVYEMSAGLTITVPVQFEPGAIIKPASGQTVRFNGGIVAPLRQVFDMSLGGNCVPANVPAWHPEWWGPVRTADDSQTWKHMVLARQVLGLRVRVIAPIGENRLWQVDLPYMHIECGGQSAIFKPALAAAAATTDPGDRYMVKMLDQASIIGGRWDSDGLLDMRVIWQAKTRCVIERVYLWLSGNDDTYGLYIEEDVASPGALSPHVDTIVAESPNGTGTAVYCNSTDGDWRNIWVAQTGRGVISKRISNTFVGLHIWGCTGVGIQLHSLNRLIGSYIETNGGWGVDCNAAFGERHFGIVIDDCHIFGNEAGGIRAVDLDAAGTGGKITDLRIVNTMIDDNLGDGILIQDVTRATIDVNVVSLAVNWGGAAVQTNGVTIAGNCPGISLSVRGDAAAVTGKLINNTGTAVIGTNADVTSVWIPAVRFSPADGATPTFGTVDGKGPAWLLDDTTEEGVTVIFDVPSTWTKITAVDLWWAPLTAAGGSTRWRFALYNLAHNTNMATGSGLLEFATAGAGGAAYRSLVQSMTGLGLTVSPNNLTRLLMRRYANHGNDTYVGDAGFLGARIYGY